MNHDNNACTNNTSDNHNESNHQWDCDEEVTWELHVSSPQKPVDLYKVIEGYYSPDPASSTLVRKALAILCEALD